jgi:hypothetical protein
MATDSTSSLITGTSNAVAVSSGGTIAAVSVSPGAGRGTVQRLTGPVRHEDQRLGQKEKGVR